MSDLVQRLHAPGVQVGVVVPQHRELDRVPTTTTALIDEVLGGLEAKLEAAKTFGDKMKGALKTLRRRVNFAKAVKLATTSALSVTLPGSIQLLDLIQFSAPLAAIVVLPSLYLRAKWPPILIIAFDLSVVSVLVIVWLALSS